jgi:predicted MarR family transcription regulator
MKFTYPQVDILMWLDSNISVSSEQITRTGRSFVPVNTLSKLHLAFVLDHGKSKTVSLTALGRRFTAKMHAGIREHNLRSKVDFNKQLVVLANSLVIT